MNGLMEGVTCVERRMPNGDGWREGSNQIWKRMNGRKESGKSQRESDSSGGGINRVREAAECDKRRREERSEERRERTIRC